MLVFTSLLLHAAKNKTPQTNACKKRFLPQRRSGATEDARSDLSLLVFAAPLRRCGRKLFLALILDRCTFILFLRHRFTGHTILTLNPTAKINKLTAFRTEGTDRIVFPLDWLTAGWTLHEFPRHERRASSQRDAGRLSSIRRLTNAIVPARRMAFKRTVTLSRVEPTMEAISRWGRGMSISTPSGSETP